MDFDRSSLPRSYFSIKLTDLIDSDFNCEAADTVIISNFESLLSFAKAQKASHTKGIIVPVWLRTQVSQVKFYWKIGPRQWAAVRIHSSDKIVPPQKCALYSSSFAYYLWFLGGRFHQKKPHQIDDNKSSYLSALDFCNSPVWNIQFDDFF